MLEETHYHGWNAVKLTSGRAEIVIPLDVGPRVIACQFEDNANLFHTVSDQLGGTRESEWLLRGGHRLWHSPEDPVRTYGPDNDEVKMLQGLNGGISFEAESPDAAGIVKTLHIEELGNESYKLTHTLKNTNLWPVRCAPWALTVLERGGYGAIPLLPKGDHSKDLLPSYSIIPWTYTDLSLPCWNFYHKHIGVATEHAHGSQKLGLTNYLGWSAYWQEAGTFVKYVEFDAGKTYPDRGSVFEIFCNDAIIELETLGELVDLEPGKTSEHVEYWKLFEGLEKPDSDAKFSGAFSQQISEWVRQL